MSLFLLFQFFFLSFYKLLKLIVVLERGIYI